MMMLGCACIDVHVHTPSSYVQQFDTDASVMAVNNINHFTIWIPNHKHSTTNHDSADKIIQFNNNNKHYLP